ncbi:MAG: site-specific integrase [Treponema sp.]|jgi:integrase|nr:site-specific integrase [Treponema sp.]
MNAYPFSVFKRANRPCYSVSFKDSSGKFLSPISTKKRTEAEALQVAFQWLRDGIPQKQAALKVLDLSLKDAARKIKTKAEAETLLNEMKRVGWIKSYVLSESPAAQDFTLFLSEFWNWNKSAYITEKRRKNHGIHRAHCTRQGQAAALYWEPFFKGRILGDITSADVDGFINHIGSLPLSAGRKNSVILAGTKPLRWAFSKGKIEADPTRGHIMYSGEEKEKQILSPAAATAVFRVEWKDGRAKLANMLAAVTGMRQGEILALRLQDLGPDCLYVRGSWGRMDGLKLPKNNKPRTVALPFPDLMQGLIQQAKQNPWGMSPDSFIFWTEYRSGIPMQGRQFIDGLRSALVNSGFSETEAGKYMFLGWRHFYTMYLLGKLEKKLLKSQTGHLTDAMLAHYGEHQTEGDRQTIQAMAVKTFGGLIPSGAICIEAAEC